MSEEINYSSTIECRHCGNVAPMRIIGSGKNTKKDRDDDTGEEWSSGIYFDILLCPACDNVMLQSGFWHDHMDSSDDWRPTVIYPPERTQVAGLPPKVYVEYQAAQKVSSVSPNAYAVLLGRVIDAVCADRGATGDTHFARLNDLADKKEIPPKLAEMAHKLRQLRNVGAHGDLGSLTKQEIPFLESLCRAVLEYVYSAPLLINMAEERLARIKSEPSP